MAEPIAAKGVMARRLYRRRQALIIHTVSYVLDAGILALYAVAGSTSPVVSAAFLLTGLGITGAFFLLSEAGVGNRSPDHFLTAWQFTAHLPFQLTFVIFAPELSAVFFGCLAVIFFFIPMRLNSRQVFASWCMAALGFGLLFLATGNAIAIPNGSWGERAVTTLWAVMILGRCAYVGLYGSSLRQVLYNRSVELKVAYSRIEELAELDELTGAHNRRCIMRALNEEIVRASRTRRPCSVALIDLDWFKTINDKFGHPMGDEVLRAFAIAIFANIRGIDRFGRYGGEEFLLILPDCTAAAAAPAVDRLRSIVASLDWTAFAPGLAVTLSAGVATARPDDTADTILARADRALYAAKDAGRNRIASG